MAKTNRTDIELNPVFAVPPHVIDVRQENSDDSYQNYEGSSDIVGPGDGPVLGTPDAPVPNAPSRYTIVSQTIRTAPDGRSVVDVLIDFPDISDINVDVRVTPA